MLLTLEPMAASNGSQPAGPAMPGLAIELPAEVPILGAVAGAVVAIPLVAVLEGEARPVDSVELAVSPPAMSGTVLGDADVIPVVEADVAPVASALLFEVGDTKFPDVWVVPYGDCAARLPEAVPCVWAAADAANDTANAVTIGVLQCCMALSSCVGGLTTVAHAGFAPRRSPAGWSPYPNRLSYALAHMVVLGDQHINCRHDEQREQSADRQTGGDHEAHAEA